MVKNFLRKVLERGKIIKFSFFKSLRNSRYILQSNSNIENLEYQALLYVHSIEKGMTHEKIRYGFGKKKLEELVKIINKYIENNYDMNRFAIQVAIKTIESYIIFHKQNDFDVEWLEKQYEILNKYNNNSVEVGIHEYSKNELSIKDDFNFDEFISRRHSIRKFSKEEITEEEILRALSIAQKAPSACNRQPIKVYYSLDSKKNELIDNVVPGNNGFKKTINKYLIVVSDISAFGSREVNQWYINGGIYLSFLVLALHSLGLGTCIFQWAYFKEKESQLREIANIKDSEEVISIVGIGKYEDKVITPIGFRKGIEEMISRF